MSTAKTLEYLDSDGVTMEGVLHTPRNMAAGDKKPGVLVLHTFAGCGDYENSRAASLSKLGFIVLAADLYGKGNRGSTRQECAAFMRPLMADRVVLLKKRLDAAVEALRAVPEVDTERLGAIGYCFGGLCALDLARRNTDGLLAAVSFHGTLTPLPDDEPRKITASVQIHHGDADPHIPATQVADFMDEMRARNADWSFTSHGNAVHGFTQPHADSLGVPGVAYNREADVRSWAATTAFLSERLFV